MAKKPFKETKLGSFLSGQGASGLLNTIGQVATGNWVGAVGSITDMINGSNELTPEKKELALQYLAQDLEAFKLEIEDRKDARSREVLINQSESSSWLAKNTISIIAIMFTLFTCTLYILVLAGNLKSSDNITFSVVSSVTGITMLIMGYYFGSSRSSQAKDGTIARLTK